MRTLASETDLEGPWARFWRRLAGVEAPVRMYHPVGVAVTPDGDLVAVTDQGLGQVFLFDMLESAVRTLTKETLGGEPVGVAFENETVWVAVPSRKALLAFDRKAKPLRAIELPDVERPTGIAVDAEKGLVYVSDTSSTAGEGHSVHVHGLAEGEHRSAIGKKGSGPGELYFPTFLHLSLDRLFVADTMNARVQEFTTEGELVRQYGERGDRFGFFDKPKGLATDGYGNLYVVDSFFSVVQIFNREGRLLLFFGGRGDSPGFLSNPSGIAIDGKNRIYVTNGLNFRVEVYQLLNTTAADSQLQGAAASLQ
ncbi:MAG: hypothetical protein HYZ28_12385 [Myxococcales bacterium]|nr:hypothetical protein [Myxococcales bacterium]